MWLVFCAHDDLPGLWAFNGLRLRGLKSVELVTAEQLMCSTRWEHRLSQMGDSVDIQLADGRRICSSRVQGVLNRLSFVPDDYLAAVSSTDKHYAAQEFTAFYMGWLRSLSGRVLNRPASGGLSGRQRHISEWFHLASQAGLSTPSFKSVVAKGCGETGNGTDGRVRTIFVLESQLVGHCPRKIKEACLQLAKASGELLLGIDFVRNPGSLWTFAGANVCPDLRLGGERLLDVLASIMLMKA